MSDHVDEKEHSSLQEDAPTVPKYGDEYTAEYDPVEDRRLFRKLDWRLLPMLSLLYLLSFLDRGNIGNAKIAGMSTDLVLTGYRYNIAAAVFFIPYIFSEIPANIALKFVRPSIWISSIMLAWGVVMTLMGIVKSYHGLVVARIFLGLAEGGLFPGITYYASLWYPRTKLAFRVSIFFSAATIAGAFGGLLAYGIEKMEGIGGLHGWQWIFLLEGLFTCIAAFSSYFIMHDYPQTAKFLTEPERAYLIHRIRNDTGHSATHHSSKFVYQALKDYKIWLLAFIYFGLVVPVYGIAFFLATIIKQLGYTAADAQLLTVPPYVIGCGLTIVTGYVSDKIKLRSPFIVAGSLICMIGFILLYVESKPGVSYFGCCLTAAGIFPTIACVLAWIGSTAGGDVKRGVAIAIVIGFGNFGGILAAFVFNDAPDYHNGKGTMLGAAGLAIICTLVSAWNFDRLNKKKIAQCKRENITHARISEFVEMGDDSPLHRYIL